jgi:formylglycine-generating enzyme required for sulfatase activity
MRELFEALKQRRVFRAGAAYAVVAWGVVQVVLTVAPELGLPAWGGRAALWLAIAGFPVALILAWVYDLSHEGVRRWQLALAVVILALFGAGVAMTFGAGRTARTGEELADIVSEASALVEEERYLEAYDLLATSRLLGSDDPRLAAIEDETTISAEILSDPEGAEVRVAAWRPGYAKPDDELRLLGRTPLRDVRLPRAIHYVRIELEGYAASERSFTTHDFRYFAGEAAASPVLSVQLDEEGLGRPEMVRVPGGSYTLVSSDLPPGLSSTLDEYLIDRLEVTNSEYADFIRDGGYRDPRYWTHEFVTGGDTLTFDEAMSRLVDRTGLPGPRSWSAQTYPADTGDHPVTGVSWYEAVAYATYRGKQLPTAFQWEKAARDGRVAWADAIMLPWGVSTAGWGPTLANFNSGATVPADAMPFGISPYGAYAMAGNVAEWLLNPAGEGRAATGGSWEGPLHPFGEFTGLDPFHASDALGFRLVYLESDRQRLSRDQGAIPIASEPVVPTYEPVDPETARTLLSHFDYDPVELAPVTTDSVDEGAWIRETISVQTPNGGRLPLFLYLPKDVLPPYQTLLYIPSGSAWVGVPVTEDTEWVMEPVVRSGRAVLSLAMTGMTGNEHPLDWEPPSSESVRFRDEIVRNAVEMRIAIDYLESRADIDMERFGYAAFSGGAGSRGVFLSADPRFRLAVLMGAGIDERVRPVRPEVDPVNFAPSLELPILIVQGRHDEEHPYYTRFLPLYQLLPAEWTRLELVQGAGHLVRPEFRVPPITEFLTENWGAVER